MIRATEPLPASIRSLDERAERDLALVEKLAPKRTHVETDRDNRDRRDTASHNGFKAWIAPGQDRDSRAKLTAPRFELIEAGDDELVPGVYRIDVAKDKDGTVTGEAPPVWICSPLRIEAMTRDPQNSEWGRLLVFTDRDHREHRWAMPMKMLAGSCEELRAVLLCEGLHITSNPSQRRLVADYIQRAHPSITARLPAPDGTAMYLPCRARPSATPIPNRSCFRRHRWKAWHWGRWAHWRRGAPLWRHLAPVTQGWCSQSPLASPVPVWAC